MNSTAAARLDSTVFYLDESIYSRTLVEALKRTGRDLSREAFVATLEHLSNFDSGFAPPLSYGPNQRAGSTTIQIISMQNGTMTVEKEH